MTDKRDAKRKPEKDDQPKVERPHVSKETLKDLDSAAAARDVKGGVRGDATARSDVDCC